MTSLLSSTSPGQTIYHRGRGVELTACHRLPPCDNVKFQAELSKLMSRLSIKGVILVFLLPTTS